MTDTKKIEAQATATRRAGPMEQLIEGIVNLTVVPMANFIGWAASSGVLLIVFGVIWAAFGAALIWSQGSLDAAWAWLRGLPLIAQGLLWLLFLPVTAGLWIWESTWPVLVRLTVVAGLAGWSILMFIPRAAART